MKSILNLFCLSIVLSLSAAQGQEVPSAIDCSTSFLRNQVELGNVTSWDLRIGFLVTRHGWAAMQSRFCREDQIPGVNETSCEWFHQDRRGVVDRLIRQFSFFPVSAADLSNGRTLDLRPGDILVQQLPWDQTGSVVVVRDLNQTTGRLSFVAWIGSENREHESRNWPLITTEADGRRFVAPGFAGARPRDRSICR